MHPVAQFTFGREPDAVPRARRQARAALSAARPGLAADAELVVSELVTNACLHGLPPISVRVVIDDVVRIEVEDAGRAAPLPLARNNEAMTGRGLGLVASLAKSWGSRPLPGGGKVVWAELDESVPPLAAVPDFDVDALLDSWPDNDDSMTYTVRLGSVATDLLLAAKAHVDNLVRELSLIREGGSSSGVALPPEVAALVQAVTVDFADARSEIKRQAVAAASRGEPVTDLELHLHASAADAGERYLAALDESDRYARSAHLLTLAPPAIHRIFRRWYVQAIIDQLRSLSRGEQPAPTVPFQVILTEEVGRLADEAATSRRLAMLQQVTGALADAHEVADMARIVVAGAVQVPGIDGAKVRLLTPEGMLRTVARAGSGAEHPDTIDEYSVDADLPGAEAVRTGEAVYMRSLKGAVAHVPELVDLYEANRSGHAFPLVVDEQPLGLLSVVFVAGELGDVAEVALVQALGDALAQGLKRAQLAVSEAETRDSFSFLADATRLLVSAHQPTEVLERLVRLAVPRLGDWCSVLFSDGPVLRRMAMAIDGHPDTARRLLGRPLSADGDTPHALAFRMGEPQFMDAGAGRLLERLYPDVDLAALGIDPERTSGLVVPIELRGQRLGVIALSCHDGRRITPGRLETVAGLADRAALALDAALRWSEQKEMVGSLVRTLLPEEPPRVAGVEFAARYLPAGGEVAGDWWEAQPLADGSVLIGIGDAAGHGLTAVSQMSALRHGGRALSVLVDSPALLLTALNRELNGRDSGFATAVYGRLDPATGELRWSSAGHVPPLKVGAGGAVTVLASPGSPPLGTPWPEEAHDELLELRPGETLVLYTDGVIERRRELLDDGLARLAATLAGHAGKPLAELADAVVDEHCGEPIDDCCLLLVRRRIT